MIPAQFPSLQSTSEKKDDDYGDDTVDSDEGDNNKDGSSSEDDEEDEQDVQPDEDLMRCPRRSTVLKHLTEEHRDLLKNNLMKPIGTGDAKKLISESRFMYVLETNPLDGTFCVVDSKGVAFLRWFTLGPPDALLIDGEHRLRLEPALGGPIRDQKMHIICWAYVDCDLISCSRVLNGLDKEFMPLSPMFLCRNVNPEEYKETRETRKGKHCCLPNGLLWGLMYAKLHGVPREKAEDKRFDCKVSKPFRGDEQLYKIKDVFYYDTLEAALKRLKMGYPIGASLLTFDGWSDYYEVKSDEEMKIYYGPKPGATYREEHAVMMVDFRVIQGEKVAICKMSNGDTAANGGYIAVSLQTMVTMVGTNKKGFWNKKPTYLLREFYSVDVEMGAQPLVSLDPEQVEEHNKFKVEDNVLFDNLIAPTYQ
ncbi:hypothetical protein Bca4012_069129 [Brassica carinata]